MRILKATLFLAATTLAAQTPPPRAPMAPMAPMAPIDREFTWQMAEEARERSRRQAEMQREQSRIQSQVARELSQRQAEMVREQSRMVAEIAREQSRMHAEMAREQARMHADLARERAQYAFAAPTPRPFAYAGPALPERPPAPWAQGDPADSLYKAAYDMMNKGDYRRAATMFKEIPVKFRYSQYAVEAMYWQAHALYRVGTTPDLQEALQTLETLKSTYPNTRIRNSQADVGALQVRIAGVLNARGMGGNEIVRRALSQNASVCDREETQIRSAALSALMQTDESSALEYAQKVLTRKDDCSRDLRRNAVVVIGNKGGAPAARALIDVAKSDPSPDVRSSAIQYLGRMQGDDALAALEDLMRSSTETQVQREAIRALAGNASPRARAGIKALVERNDVTEQLRITALDALNPERATQEDVVWLQSLYGKVENPRIRSRVISAMARMGGQQNERWFMQLANNENEAIDVRVAALRQAGQTMDIAGLGRLYDQTGQRPLRYELVRQLGSRREPEAVDKLGEIAKNGTDVEVRMRAIDALRNKKDDPRATRLLLQLIDRP